MPSASAPRSAIRDPIPVTKVGAVCITAGLKENSMAEEELLSTDEGDAENLLGDPQPPEDGDGVVLAPGAAVVEDKCPICLDDYQDKAFITTCFHILSY